MPAFQFTSPEGKNYTVEGPEGSTAEQAFQILQGQIGSAPGGLTPDQQAQIPRPIGVDEPPAPPAPVDHRSFGTKALDVAVGPVDAGVTLLDAVPKSIYAGVMGLLKGGDEQTVSRILSEIRQPQTQTGQVFIENISDLLQSHIAQALPGLGGELGMLGKGLSFDVAGIKSRIGTTGLAAPLPYVPKLPNIKIPGSGIVGKATGNTAKTAAEGLKSKFGDVGSQVAERTAEEGNAATVQAFKAQQDARVGMRSLEDESALRTAEETKKAEALLNKHVGNPRSKEQIGQPLQEQIGSKLNERYEARAKEAEDLYGKTVAAGQAKEAAGQPFAKSPQGQEALAKLKAMRDTVRGTNPLLPQERATLDALISTLEGDAKTAPATPLGKGAISSRIMKPAATADATPAGIEPLMKQLRLIRKYDEQPMNGVAALPKQFAQQIERVLEPALYGEKGWVPEGGAADAAYKLASRKLEAFETEAMRRATRGEKFDFRQMAASPSEFAARFFKDGQSVRQLKAAIEDPGMVTKAAKDWAASQLRPMKAAQAKEWAIKNEDALREAGVKDSVNAYVKDLQDHETQVALRQSQEAARAKSFADDKARAKKIPGEVEARNKAVSDRFQTLQTELRNTEPKAVSGKIREFGKQLVADGHIDQAQYEKMLQEAADVDKHFSDSKAVQRNLMKIGALVGIGGGVSGYAIHQVKH